MFQIFDTSSARQHRGEHCSHAIAWSRAAIVMLRAMPLRLIPNKGHSAGVDRCYTIDLKLMLLVRLLRAMLLLPLAPPTQRLSEHHGTVMDWARCGLSDRHVKSPCDPSFSADPGEGLGNDARE
jgi:hypothetical protein